MFPRKIGLLSKTIGFFLILTLFSACSTESENQTDGDRDGDRAETPLDGDTDGENPPDGDGEDDVDFEIESSTCPWLETALDEAQNANPADICEAEACIADPVTIVPSDALPAGVTLQQANNNLDATEHDCRVYLAFRTAESHFASPYTELYVISSEDRIHWDFEMTYTMGTDLREPRLLSWDGRLFLYFAVLGENILDFEPKGMMVSERLGPGNWTVPEWFHDEGFIPWRVKTIDGKPYMLTYVGGENIYDINGEGMEVHWLTTEDGVNWTPVIPEKPAMLAGGGSETDFVFLSDGTLIAMSRNEAGDEQYGFGSILCRAEADALGDWQCISDPKKYDSPLMFVHNDTPYLIGRRNLTETGNYDLGMEDLTMDEKARKYELNYWTKPKRTSLWRIDPVTLEVDFVLDLPSKGDTCFPGIVPLEDGSWEIYNYTSPLDGEDVAWNTGQTGPTLIYRILLNIQ